MYLGISCFSCLLGYNVTEVAHDCVKALKNWFEGRGIKNSFDTWHGEHFQDIHMCNPMDFCNTSLNTQYQDTYTLYCRPQEGQW